MGQHLAFFVHDVADAAVLRRVKMIQGSGATVTVIGFRRSAARLTDINGAPVIDLGQTGDGQFAQRIWAVLRTMLAFGAVRAAAAHADVLMARNLETLVLAARAAGQRRLVYECLDIHRLLLADGVLARLVQRVERAALRRVDLIATSSPRFEDDYFRRLRHLDTPILLAENKVIAPTAPQREIVTAPRTSGPPWVIGWFGMLRCRRSLAILADMAAASNGRIEILIAGIPSDAEFTDFASSVAAMPNVTFIGRYRPDDLAALYGRVHFAWAVDFFEEGLNSDWLLPNRLYEALSYGAVPIALSSVETGGWLRRHNVGLVVESVDAVQPLLANMTDTAYHSLTDAVASLPRDAVEMTEEEVSMIAETILGQPIRNGAP